MGNYGYDTSLKQKHRVHPDVAVHMGLWISPHFGVHVSRILRNYASRHPEAVQDFCNSFSKDGCETSCLSGYLYVLQTTLVPTRVKIGHCRQSLVQLRNRYRTAFPDNVRIYAIQVPESYTAEQDIHTFFAEYRCAGEWFAVEQLDEYLDYITNVFGADLLVFEDADQQPITR